MSIKDWPSDDRPREKLLSKGAAALSDAELLAIFLRTGTKGYSAVDLARELIQRFGVLRQLLNANLETFCEGQGLGAAKYAQLQAVLEMGRRHLAEQLQRGGPLSSPRDAQSYLLMQLRDLNREVFCCVFLDTRHRVLAYEELFAGRIDGATVHPREVIKRALELNAAAVIVAHNHPSGVA